MKKKSLNTIKKIYERGGNIIEYLKGGNISRNSDEMIMISYDLQSGTYLEGIKKDPDFNEKRTKAIAKVIDNLGVKYDSILEIGVGEATTLANLVPKLRTMPKKIFGFDISWSRIRYAVDYLKKKGLNNTFLFMGDLFNIPLADNSIDIVYTSHSIEPNGGREKEALLELIRVSKKYLILLEPAYELAGVKAKKRMEKHGYIQKLYSTAISLGLNVKEYRLFDVYSNPLNPTGIMIIEKEKKCLKSHSNLLICPITKTSLRLLKNAYFTKDGLLVYPVVDKIPCLLKDNAIIATHYSDDFKS